MTPSNPSFFSRLALAFATFFAILFDPRFAARILRLRNETDLPTPEVPKPAPPPPPPPLKTSSPEAALQLLGLLQREARLIDFIEEDVTAYADADIGAAARLVHEGCAKVMREYFSVTPVRDEAEGSRIVLNEGFDASAIRLTGNVVGQPPFRGTLSHRGWKVTETRLPKLAESHDARVIAPAEVEL
ncbi:MAG TPA: DUF2760 domain-containing protein [Rhodocyclaceae bacterium]|nr:DUF2760 domain-containing protein [Rhodocyclaceae bacterium]